MMILEQMSLMKVGYVVGLVTLLFSSMALCLEDMKVMDEVSPSELVDLASGVINEEMVHLLWSHCWTDLIQIKEIIEDLDLCLPHLSSSSNHNFDSKCQSIVEETLQNMLNDVQPSLKQRLVDCLKRNIVVSHVSGEDESKSWYTVFAVSLSSKLGSPRRYLGSESTQGNAQTPAPAPATQSAVTSPAPAPAGSKDPSSPPPPESPHVPLFPTNNGSPTPSTKNKAVEQTSVSGASSNDHSSEKAIVIAVVVTAVVTFTFAGLLFLCYIKFCSTGYRRGHNDERPLISLSLSEYSIGSSFKPFAPGESIKEEKPGHQTLGINSSNKDRTRPLSSFFEPGYMDDVVHENFEAGSADGAVNAWVTFDSPRHANAPQYHLKPPPGRGPTVGLLKPPPGRAEPLPPEPPAPPKPPGMTGAGPAASSPIPPPPPRPPAAAPPPPGGSAAPRPPGPPPLQGTKRGPPPPLPKGGAPPKPPPPLGSKAPRPPLHGQKTSGAVGLEEDTEAPKTKLKPFFWDKVMANPDDSMVWHQIKSGSFQFNEEMIESLFGYAQGNKDKNGQKKESSSQDSTPQYIQIIDAKKAQNLAILLKALNVTIEEVCDALHEGTELPIEFLQNLLKMAPTTDEELKLRLYSGQLSQLGPADRFLKAMIDIPFAFKRMEALLFMSTLQEEVTSTKDSFSTLEVACKELRNSRLFLKLLEAVLKTGNRMNDGTFRGGAQAFKLDTLLKLSDVKGVDGKTTLLHFVVQEIIRSEGIKAARAARESQSFTSVNSDDLSEDAFHDTEEYYRDLGLQVVSRLGNELQNVKKAAAIDADGLTGTVAKFGHSLLKTRNFLNSDMENSHEESQFRSKLKSFVNDAEMDVTWLLGEEKRIMALVKSTGDYFHGNAGKDEGLRLFVIVRDFLILLDKVCKEVRNAPQKPKAQKKEGNPGASPAPPSPDLRQRFFPAIAERRMDSSSSDDES